MGLELAELKKAQWQAMTEGGSTGCQGVETSGSMEDPLH
jgi:hypothetical protein